MTRPPRALTLCPLALLVVAGCAGTVEGDGEPTVVAARSGPGVVPGRRCSYVGDPEALPRLSDVAALSLAGDLDLWGYGGERADSALLSIRYAADGSLAWIRAIDSSLPAWRIEALERLLGGAVLQPGPPSSGLRLRVAGDGGAIALRPSVVCRAELESMPRAQELPFMVADRQYREIARARGTVEALVSLDEQGRVVDVELRHGTGSRAIDRYAVDLARESRYLPELHDGFGVPTIYRVRLRVGYR